MVKVSILFVFSIVIIFSFFKQKMTSVFTIANMQWQPDQIIRPPAQLNVWVKTHRYNTKLHKMWISGEQNRAQLDPIQNPVLLPYVHPIIRHPHI